MKLSVRALTFAAALIWGGGFLIVALSNHLWPTYGTDFLELMSSLYPGYIATGTMGSVVVGSLYAVVDGGVGGALFAWLYNACAR